jgi:N-acyl-D-amino-acid deacylase
MPPHDLVIRNAMVADGTGAPSRALDVAVSGERIVQVAPIITGGSRAEIDAGGLVLSPGFIDAHTHDDRAALEGDMLCKLSQGVTSVVAGNCGISLAPLVWQGRPPAPLDLIAPSPGDLFADFAGYFAALDRARPALNVVAQAGHSTLRLAAMASIDRPATTAETGRMQDLLREALQQGAAGLSTGLAYPLARAALTGEIEAIAAVAEEFGAFHSTHMRDEAGGVMESLAETFRIGRKARVASIISHHKCIGACNHGRSAQTLPFIAEEMAVSRIGLDVYPYAASSTMLEPLRIATAARVMIAWSKPHPEATGEDFHLWRARAGLSVEQALEALSPAGAIYFNMDEADVARILAFPATMVGSDGLPHDAHPHPRLWGTFPRVIGRYARDQHLFPMEEAIRKMTGLTADTFGIVDRGLVAEGHFADLVLFDPARIIDKASFEQPELPAEGIVSVWVNGTLTFSDGAMTGARAGRALRRGIDGALRALPFAA